MLGIVQRTSFEDMTCSVAKCLDIVGEWWSLLIIRDAFLGVTRFDDFQARLGISRNILTQRLNRLVEHEILKRVGVPPHRQGPRPVARGDGHAAVGRHLGGSRRSARADQA